MRDMWRIVARRHRRVPRRRPVVYLSPVARSGCRAGSPPSNWLLTLAFVAGAALLVRTVIERPVAARARRARQGGAVVGAGDAAQLIVRELLKSPRLGYTPIGLVDDDPRKKNLRLHGVRVLGTTADLPDLLRDSQPDEVLIAIPSASGEARQRIVDVCRQEGVPVKTLPALYELISGDLDLAGQIRPGPGRGRARPRAGRGRPGAVASYLKGETVLVTGAGGSIGSELCRQIARLGAARLILVDHSEPALFEIERELVGERRLPARRSR